MARRRRTVQRSRVGQTQLRPGFSRRPPPSARRNGPPWAWLAAGAVGVAVLLAVVYFGFIGGAGGQSPAPSPSPTPAARPSFNIGPPSATPLANPPAEPAGDGTRATIETELGTMVMELYTESSPVAAENFINLAEAGFYDGVVFHRIVPGFVIQGGDPEGSGGGGPGYEIEDDAVVGEYIRGTVAMARPANPDGGVIPDSQGSQFFIVLDDDVRNRLPKSGGYAIFGRIVEGMEVVDQIAAGEAQRETPIDPVLMTRVTVQRP